MKKGYIRLLIFCLCIFSVILLDTIFYKILNGYIRIGFLVILLLVFYKFYVIEKDKTRYFKEVLFEIIFYTILYFILFYLLGLIVGLHKTPNYYNLTSLKDVIIPMILFCILREILRYNLLCKAEGNKLCIILVVFTIFIIDICDDFSVASFKTQYDVLKFVALALLPCISRNISYSFISMKAGYKPVIIFDLIFSLYPYLIPLLPNPSEYLMAIIYLIVPILFVFRLYRFFQKKKDNLLPSDYKKKKFKGLLLPSIVIMIIVYFYSGYFRLYSIAIASGSMTPNIRKGDIVIVDQKSLHNINIGDVIAYRHENIIVVHRVVKKEKFSDNYVYYTKGDANDHIDNLSIEEDVIIGIVKFKIPYIGYPTVWFNKE